MDKKKKSPLCAAIPATPPAPPLAATRAPGVCGAAASVGCRRRGGAPLAARPGSAARGGPVSAAPAGGRGGSPGCGGWHWLSSEGMSVSVAIGCVSRQRWYLVALACRAASAEMCWLAASVALPVVAAEPYPQQEGEALRRVLPSPPAVAE